MIKSGCRLPIFCGPSFNTLGLCLLSIMTEIRILREENGKMKDKFKKTVKLKMNFRKLIMLACK